MDDDTICAGKTPELGTADVTTNRRNLHSSNTVAHVPSRKMSRRHSFHQRNESAPDFFDDMILTQDFGRVTEQANDDTSLARNDIATSSRNNNIGRTRSRGDSPSSSAVFVSQYNASTNETPAEKSQRVLHARRKSGTMEDWELGLKKALNEEVNKFTSGDNLTKMKKTYKRALQPRGMLKIPGSPSMRSSMVKLDAKEGRVPSNLNTGKKEDRTTTNPNHSQTTPFHNIKPRSLDMDALAREETSSENHDTQQQEDKENSGKIHRRNESGDASLSDENDDGEGNASIVINDIDESSEDSLQDREGQEEEEYELTKFDRVWNHVLVYLFYLHTSVTFQVIVLVASIVALLAADISLLSFHSSTESFVDFALGCSAALLLLDLVVCLQIRRGYSYTILSFMDFVAVLAIVIEIRWVFKVLLIFFSKTDSFENFFAVLSEIAESARLTNIPKILRIALQLFSHCFDIEGYVADVNYIIGDDDNENDSNVHGLKSNQANGKKEHSEDGFKDLKIILPENLKADALPTEDDNYNNGTLNSDSAGGELVSRNRTDSSLSLSSSNSESDYEYEDEDNDIYSFKTQDVEYYTGKGERNSAILKKPSAVTKEQEHHKNRAKIPGSTLILALDKIASPWLHEIGTVVLEFMTARMVLMILLFLLIIRLLSNDQSARQQSMGLNMLDKFAAVDPYMNSTEFTIAVQEYTLRHDGTDKKGTYYNKDQPLAYLRINGVDILNSIDMQQSSLYGRREDELEYTILRTCARPPINERFARLVLLRECRSVAVWDNRRLRAQAALNNILKTIFITFTLALGMIMIGYDLNVLVLDPIDGLYQVAKEMLFTINWSGIGSAMKTAEEEQDDDLDEYQRNVRNIARSIILCGDLFVKSKPILNEKVQGFRDTAVDLDARYGKNKEDLVPAVDSIIANINPTVEAVKLIIDGVDAVMVPTYGDIDIYAPQRRDSEFENQNRPFSRQNKRSIVSAQPRSTVGALSRPTHGYHRSRRDSQMTRRETISKQQGVTLSNTGFRRQPEPSVRRQTTFTPNFSPFNRRDSFANNDESGRGRSGSGLRNSTSAFRRRSQYNDNHSPPSDSPSPTFSRRNTEIKKKMIMMLI